MAHRPVISQLRHGRSQHLHTQCNLQNRSLHPGVSFVRCARLHAQTVQTQLPEPPPMFVIMLSPRRQRVQCSCFDVCDDKLHVCPTYGCGNRSSAVRRADCICSGTFIFAWLEAVGEVPAT